MIYNRDTVKKLAKDVYDIHVSASLCRSMSKPEDILESVHKFLKAALDPFKDLISEAAQDQTDEGLRKLKESNEKLP